MVLTMISINLVYQFWVHTEAVDKLPVWFEWIFNTPSHHRVHHGSNVAYLDQNHGGVLIIWDRLFGTFVEEVPKHPVVYGLTKNLTGRNPLYFAVAGYLALWRDLKTCQTWSQRFGFLFKAPGWHFEGPDLRAKIRRAAAQE